MTHDVIDHERELARTRAELPDTALLTDYTLGVLSAGETDAIERRLIEDEEFRAFAAPILAATRAARLQPHVTSEQVGLAWHRFRETVRRTTPPPPVASAIPALRRWQLAALLLVAALPATAWFAHWLGPRLGGPGVYEHVVTEAAGREVTLINGGTVRLSAGSRFFRQTHVGRDGTLTFTLHTGAANFQLPTLARGAYHVLTPSGRVVVTGTRFVVDVRDPQVTHVRVYEGSVLLEPVGAGASYDAVSLVQNQEGLLVYNQPPRRTQ